jgi:hypothetical protein
MLDHQLSGVGITAETTLRSAGLPHFVGSWHSFVPWKTWKTRVTSLGVRLFLLFHPLFACLTQWLPGTGLQVTGQDTRGSTERQKGGGGLGASQI